MIFDRGKKLFVIVKIMLLESHVQHQIRLHLTEGTKNEQETKVLNP